jgi:Asp/Glu/hydantoin racemase
MAPNGRKKLLVINPNSTQSMTDALEKTIKSIYSIEIPFELYMYTAPSGPASINDQKDCNLSAVIVLEDLKSHLKDYDAILVACYSVHPLVPRLQSQIPKVAVTGIFEASIKKATERLQGTGQGFGIVTTGGYWVNHLTKGVLENRLDSSVRFRGVMSTGLNADEYVVPKAVDHMAHCSTCPT